jgi:hypothetical protein
MVRLAVPFPGAFFAAEDFFAVGRFEVALFFATVFFPFDAVFFFCAMALLLNEGVKLESIERYVRR